MDIAQNIDRIKAALPAGVMLVAVSKTHPEQAVMQAYRAGQRVFGENKAQELCAKYQALPKDIRWHMIGHLQSNKVKHLASFVDMIQSVDSPELLRKIDAAAAHAGRTIDCLLEVRIAAEETKFGLEGEDALRLALSDEVGRMKNIRLRGLMGMASNTPDREQICREFRRLKDLWDRLRAQAPAADVLSMGMSGDYPLAVECGSTMVRVGSGIFGQRNHNE